MIKKTISLLLFFLLHLYTNAQVGIGTNTPSLSSSLELSSNDTGLLIPRIALQSTTDTTTITNGNVESLLVYNTTIATGLSVGYYYWSNSQWNRVATLDDITAGALIANNGLTINAGQIKLGGTLNQPTEISSSSSNTLALSGLGTSASSLDEILVIDPISNIIKTRPTSSNTLQNQSTVLATNGQLQFTTPLPTSDFNKIDVYRNGVRVNFTIVGVNTIELEPEATCFLNDEVRIVHLL